MNDLGIEELKQLLTFYKQKSAELEFTLLQAELKINKLNSFKTQVEEAQKLKPEEIVKNGDEPIKISSQNPKDYNKIVETRPGSPFKAPGDKDLKNFYKSNQAKIKMKNDNNPDNEKTKKKNKISLFKSKIKNDIG